MSDVTNILERLNSGKDPNAAVDLLSVVYEELRIMARARMSREKPGHTLQATVLVNDAWLKLFPAGTNPKFENRPYFFKAAGNAMHLILVDHARRKNAAKRGKKEEMSDTQFAEFVHPAPDDLILAVHEALERFGKIDVHTASLVELRFFVGMSMEEVANTLGIPKRTAERDFAYFSAWFHREFDKELKV